LIGPRDPAPEIPSFEMVKDGLGCSTALARQKEGGEVGMRPLLCVL
jgi:hypothetical protein